MRLRVSKTFTHIYIYTDSYTRVVIHRGLFNEINMNARVCMKPGRRGGIIVSASTAAVDRSRRGEKNR